MLKRQIKLKLEQRSLANTTIERKI